MRKFKKPILAAGVGVSMLAVGAIQPAMAEVGFGKPGEAIDLVVGYQPYYTESWSGVVINGQQSWKKYLPAGSDVKFEIGLQGSVIVGKMLGEKKIIWATWVICPQSYQRPNKIKSTFV